jgi:hypothetical protein
MYGLKPVPFKSPLSSASIPQIQLALGCEDDRAALAAAADSCGELAELEVLVLLDHDGREDAHDHREYDSRNQQRDKPFVSAGRMALD